MSPSKKDTAIVNDLFLFVGGGWARGAVAISLLPVLGQTYGFVSGKI